MVSRQRLLAGDLASLLPHNPWLTVTLVKGKCMAEDTPWEVPRDELHRFPAECLKLDCNVYCGHLEHHRETDGLQLTFALETVFEKQAAEAALLRNNLQDGRLPMPAMVTCDHEHAMQLRVGILFFLEMGDAFARYNQAGWVSRQQWIVQPYEMLSLDSVEAAADGSGKICIVLRKWSGQIAFGGYLESITDFTTRLVHSFDGRPSFSLPPRCTSQPPKAAGAAGAEAPRPATSTARSSWQ